jgi:hypothetical protein
MVAMVAMRRTVLLIIDARSLVENPAQPLNRTLQFLWGCDARSKGRAGAAASPPPLSLPITRCLITRGAQFDAVQALLRNQAVGIALIEEYRRDPAVGLQDQE